MYLFVVMKLRVPRRNKCAADVTGQSDFCIPLLQENRNTVRSIESVYAPTRRSHTKRVFMLVVMSDISYTA